MTFYILKIINRVSAHISPLAVRSAKIRHSAGAVRIMQN